MLAEVDDPQSSYGEHLPRLFDLLSGLTKNIAHETNEASISFMTYLHEVETAIAAEKDKTDAAISHISDLEDVSAQHSKDQMKLTRDMMEVKKVGAMIREEIKTTREVMQSIADAINNMRVGFGKLDDVTAAILDLEVKVNATSEKYPDALSDFTDISMDVARLANATNAISRKLHPYITSATRDVAPYTSEEEQEKQASIFANLDKQNEIMRNVQSTVSGVTWNFAELVELNEEQQSERKAMSKKIEGSIRNAISSAQLGDVIRQQAETIDQMLQEMSTFIRDRDISSDIRNDVDNLISQLSQKYVMYSQRRIHTQEGHEGDDSWSDNDGDLKIELF